MLEHATGKSRHKSGIGGHRHVPRLVCRASGGVRVRSRTIQSQLKLLGHFNEWLIRRRSDIHQLNDELVGTFVKQRTRRARVHRGDPQTLHQFLTHLRTRGELAPCAPVVDESPLGQLQREYAQYLTAERGLAPVTVSDYVDVLAAVPDRSVRQRPVGPRRPTVSTITTFVLRHAHTMSPGPRKAW